MVLHQRNYIHACRNSRWYSPVFSSSVVWKLRSIIDYSRVCCATVRAILRIKDGHREWETFWASRLLNISDFVVVLEFCENFISDPMIRRRMLGHELQSVIQALKMNRQWWLGHPLFPRKYQLEDDYGLSDHGVVARQEKAWLVEIIALGPTRSACSQWRHRIRNLFYMGSCLLPYTFSSAIIRSFNFHVDSGAKWQPQQISASLMVVKTELNQWGT